MDILSPGRPLETAAAQVLLDPQLAPGRYRVELVVTSASGTSLPARLLITVAASPRPPTGVTLTPAVTAPVGVTRPVGLTAPVGVTRPVGVTATPGIAAPVDPLQPARPRRPR